MAIFIICHKLKMRVLTPLEKEVKNNGVKNVFGEIYKTKVIENFTKQLVIFPLF